MTTATKSFEITLNGRFSLSRWWDNKYPSEPYWQIQEDHHPKVMKKYQKGVLKDVRSLLQKSVGEALVTDVTIKEVRKSDTIFSITIMGSQESIDSVDLSKIM